MRSRAEIKRDFSGAMGNRKDEFLEYQRQKLIMEILLDIRDLLKKIIKTKGEMKDEKSLL